MIFRLPRQWIGRIRHQTDSIRHFTSGRVTPGQSRGLMDAGPDRESGKVPGFVDNRRDTGLRAGRFDDFPHILLLRNALFPPSAPTRNSPGSRSIAGSRTSVNTPPAPKPRGTGSATPGAMSSSVTSAGTSGGTGASSLPIRIGSACRRSATGTRMHAAATGRNGRGITMSWRESLPIRAAIRSIACPGNPASEPSVRSRSSGSGCATGPRETRGFSEDEGPHMPATSKSVIPRLRKGRGNERDAERHAGGPLADGFG